MTCTAMTWTARCTDTATPKRLSFPSLSQSPGTCKRSPIQAGASVSGWRKTLFFFDWIFNMETTNTSTGQQESEVQMIKANICMADDREVATIGLWHSVVDGTESGEYLLFHKGMETHSLYQWLGLELHSVQQGASALYYQDRVVHAVSMEDTCGAPVGKYTILNVGGELVSVSAIAADDPIQWPAG